MKKLIVIAIIGATIVSPAMARGSHGGGSHSVRGYTRSNGTYVAPHMQTNPNSTRMDNWSTKGNVNPYTGKAGTVDPYQTSSTTTTK